MPNKLLATLFAGSLVLAACGDDDAASPTTTTTAAASTTTAAGDPAPAAGDVVAAGTTTLGDTLVDADGFTLYGFTPDDEAGVPTCAGGCAGAWPPLLVDDGFTVPDGLGAEFTTVEHPDGGMQLKAGTWPLYTFASDAAPGDINGQGSGGNWFVVNVDGSLYTE